MKKVSLLLGLACACLAILSGTSHAVDGIGVSPGFQEVVLGESDESISFTVTVANSTANPARYRVSTLDFGALDDTGGVAFLGSTGQETNTYGLSNWMQLDKTEVSLAPGQTTDITIRIENQDSLSPGGHYGAVVLTSLQVEQGSSDSIAAVPAASSLVLLKKTGGEVLDLQIDSINTNKSLIRLPSSQQIKFYNAGNTHLVPRGTVELTGPFGGVISRGVLNESSAYILPETHRIYNVPLSGYSQPWLPGRYTLTTNWRYDGEETFQTTVSHQWYIGRLGLLVIIMLSLIIVLLLFAKYRRRPLTRN